MKKHRLVVIGDSLSQGFMSGAIYRTDISYPAMVAHAMGLGPEEFVVPDFSGKGGLPVNIEEALRRLSRRYGETIDFWETVPVYAELREMLDDIEDYWETGKGAQPFPQRSVHHNLAVWGFEVRDAYAVTEGVCRRNIPPPKDHILAVKQIPERPMYRTARRVLNPTYANDAMEWSALRCARELAAEGNIENLLVFLGANNALGTVTSLSIKYSEQQDLHRDPHERSCNLYIPDHFEELYGNLVDEIDRVGAQRVFLATVPHVTIPPVTRGVSPSGGPLHKDPVTGRRYYEYYTRPWVWDSDFDPEKHGRLSREDAIQIDRFIDKYNAMIRKAAKGRKSWHVVDVCALLDTLAFRSQQGNVGFKFSAAMVKAIKGNANLAYLVDEETGQPRLDTRYIRTVNGPGGAPRLEKGGLFSLDGIHPTTIGYGLVAEECLRVMKAAKVTRLKPLDWDRVVAMDTLVNDPPAMLNFLGDALVFMDRRGLLSSVFRQFGN